MNDALRIKFAEFEGWEYDGYNDRFLHKTDCQVAYIGRKPFNKQIPTYDNDSDIDRCVRLLGDNVYREYVGYVIVEYTNNALRGLKMSDDDFFKLLAKAVGQATVEQKIAAFVKAMGWEDVK